MCENSGRDWQSDCVTPLYLALNFEHSDIVEIIVKQPNIDYNVKDLEGGTLAQVAVTKGGIRCAETLAAQEKCQCWNVPDRDGDTPVLKALKTNQVDILKILLKCPRVDLNMKDKNGDSLIMVALKEDKTEIAEIIMRCPRVDLNCRDSEGWSLLFRAIAMKNKGKYSNSLLLFNYLT